MQKFDITKDYVRQNNLAVDTCAAAIVHARAWRKPLKSIWLTPAYYNIFKKWMIEKVGEEKAMSMAWEMDGVNIELGSRLQIQPLSFEYWPTTRPAEA